MFTLFLRTVIIYLFLLLTLRLTGKRQVGQLQLSELITAFLISEVAAAPLSDPDVPLLYALLPILLLSCLEVMISFFITKSPLCRRLFESPPAVLIADGKLNLHAMAKQRLTPDELIGALREKDVGDLGSLRYCFLEQGGQISAFAAEDALTFPVVVDGKVHPKYLKLIGRDERWVKERVRADGKRLPDVFLLLTDGNLTHYTMKEKEKKK